MKSISFLIAVLFSSAAFAKVQTQWIEYKDGKTVMRGYLAYDDATTERKPGVLIVHDWLGLGKHFEQLAEKLASEGYVAFAADIYGVDNRPQGAEQAGKTAGSFKSDTKLLRQRVNLALDVLEDQKNVNTKKIAAIGYCFGGTTVLELARSGAKISGVVSFHGGLSTPNPKDASRIKSKVLVLHGADDPHVPAAEIAGFEQEMRSAKVDWQFFSYSGAVHAFTIPQAGNDNSKGAAYNKSADERSWKAMKVFFNEIFG